MQIVLKEAETLFSLLAQAWRLFPCPEVEEIVLVYYYLLLNNLPVEPVQWK